jgi:predicted deacylase
MKTLIKKIKGKNKKGKNILIIAGVHGEEVTPVYSLSIFLRQYVEVVKQDFKSITVINGINMDGLKHGTRDVPNNSTSDLNRMFVYETKTNALSLLKEHIEESDIVIDVHSSPSCMDFALIDIDEYMNSMKGWCDKSSVPAAFRYSGADTIKRYCLDMGKPALTIELNKLNVIDYASAKNGAEILTRLILRSKDYAKIEKKEPGYVKELVEIKTYVAGIVDYHLKNGQHFSAGDTLYSIQDLELNIIHDYVANFDGFVVCEPTRQFAKRGDTLYLTQPKW